MQKEFAKVPEAFTFAFGLPPILGLSTTGGFQYMLEDRWAATCMRWRRPPTSWCRRPANAPNWEPS